MAAPSLQEELAQEALILRSWGWSPFPVTREKKPRVRWNYYQNRRPSDREICSMFALEGVAGIGVVTGPISGTNGVSLVVRDFDAHPAYEEWQYLRPSLAGDAPTVITSRGRHVCVRVPGHVSWRKLSAGELIGDSKHYFIVPPSRHPSGHEYRWLAGPPLGINDFPLVSLRDSGFIQELRMPEKSQKKQAEPRQRRQEDLNALCPKLTVPLTLPLAIREAALRTQPNGPGQRNERLHQFARALRDVIPDDAPPGQLHDSVNLWWTMALPVIRTKAFEQSLDDFRRAWAAVRVPISFSMPMIAMRNAVAQTKGNNRSAVLLAACEAQAALSPDGTFFLGCRTAAMLTGMPRMTASRELAKLVKGGSLRIVKPGMRSARLRLATVYRLSSVTP